MSVQRRLQPSEGAGAAGLVRRRAERAGAEVVSAAVVAVAGGSEWFYPEGPAPPFSAGTGAAPCSSSLTMAFTFAAFCYMLALLLTAALIFFAIWHVSSRGCGREGEAAAQPLFARGSRSGPPRRPVVCVPGLRSGWCGRAARGLRAIHPRFGGRGYWRSLGARSPGGCARGVLAQAARTATPPGLGGAAAVQAGPCGSALRSHRPLLARGPASPYPRIPGEDVNGMVVRA